MNNRINYLAMALGIIFAAANLTAGIQGLVPAIMGIVGTYAGVVAFVVFAMTLKK